MKEHSEYEKPMKYDSVIFDLDGTLWDPTWPVAYTWNKVLEREGIHLQFTEEAVQAEFGYPLPVIATHIFPDYPPERQQELIEKCCAYENEYMAIHGATLYPDLEKTLARLKQHYKLFIVSNCQAGYIEAFLQANRMWDIFDDFECPGNTGKFKKDNIRLVMERNGLKAPVYVGDTKGDETAAHEAGIPFILAAYGFGDTDRYEGIIHSFAQLPEALLQR